MVTLDTELLPWTLNGYLGYWMVTLDIEWLPLTINSYLRHWMVTLDIEWLLWAWNCNLNFGHLMVSLDTQWFSLTLNAYHWHWMVILYSVQWMVTFEIDGYLEHWWILSRSSSLQHWMPHRHNPPVPTSGSCEWSLPLDCWWSHDHCSPRPKQIGWQKKTVYYNKIITQKRIIFFWITRSNDN